MIDILSPKVVMEIEDIMKKAERKNPLPYSNDTYNPADNFREFLDERVEYRFGKYPYKPTLDIFITDRYTAEGAWAHTEPERRVVCTRPHERLGYDLFLEHPWAMNIPFGIVLVHEVGHNYDPGAAEGKIRSLAFNPDSRHMLNAYNLKYHGRN